MCRSWEAMMRGKIYVKWSSQSHNAHGNIIRSFTDVDI
jgi:hypothetical protein